MKTETAPTSSGGLRRRLIRGFGATALGPVVTAIVQLGSVPLLLHAWGPAKYGDWLLLSAVPSYLTLSDIGFGDASGSDMSVRAAANDRQGALETFQSSWILVTTVSFAVLLATAASVWWIPWRHWLRLSSVSDFKAATVMFILAAYVIVAQQNGITESGYRCDGNFATGTLWIMVLRLTEAVAATCVAVMGGSLVSVALTYLAMRILGSVGYAALLLRKSPWLHYGIRHARLERIREMVRPALGFTAFPIGNALSLQGLTILVGALLGPVAVVSFSTMRTLSRLNFQLVNVVVFALWPELSKAFGEGNISLARKIHRHACQASLGLSLIGALFLGAVGPFVFRLWTRGAVNFDANCFHVLLLVIIANSLWYTSSVVPMSTNAHHRIAVTHVLASAVSLCLSWILVHPFGLVGAALGLLLIDASMTWLVLRTALGQVQDTFDKFVVALFTALPFGRSLRTVPGT
jgi:O-antigen/teichoic acid export membrane protein